MPSHSNIRTLQEKGELTEAVSLCRRVLLDRPSDNQTIALLGVLYAQQEDYEQALVCLERIGPSESIDNAETLTDIAAIHLLLQDYPPALALLDRAITLAPDYALAQARRGLVLMKQWQFADAKVAFGSALLKCPGNQQAALHINSARCALYLGENEAALTHVEQARELGGSQREQWLSVAVDSHIALNDWENAEAAIYQALEAGIAELKAVKLLALVLAAQDKQGQAAHRLRKALKKYPDDLDLILQLAALARVQGHHGEAMRYLQQALKLEPENASLWAQLAQLGQRHFNELTAQAAAEKAMALTEQETGLVRAEALVAMASVDEDQAENYYRQALAQVPGYVPACLGLGHLMLQWGRIDEAVALFEGVATNHPVAGYGALINARRFPEDPEILAKIEKIAYLPSLQGSVSSSLLFDLAAAWEHLKDYPKAFAFVTEANNASRKLLPYRACDHRKHCVVLRRTFTRSYLESNKEYGNPSTLPTFVLGMPRSGTTLVEQILGGHPEIYVAGEIAVLSKVIQSLNAWERHIGSGKHYPECVPDLTPEQIQFYAKEVLDELRQYDPDAKHIVDKLPHNFEHIGLIRLLFPNAPIIHVQREPRDVAISNYFVDYQAKFGGMGFAYDLTDIGDQLLDHQALMRHWDHVLDKPLLTIHYENVVADTKGAARSILSYLELEWTDAVLAYQNLERAVKTASVWQVRQPIYQTSKEKWRCYEAFLQPLEEVLAKQLPDEADNSAGNLLPAGYFFHGMEHLKDNNLTQAEGVFTKILQQNPNHAAAMHMLGMVRYRQGQLRLAEEWVNLAIKNQPNHAAWYNNLSAIYRDLGLNPEALAAGQQAQKIKTRIKEVSGNENKL
ncbi:MAG: sulfotransferase [Methyloglobulus sp.]|nr:tetratricopeptide repeat protein [Methyloglobulus sp.]